VNSQKLVSRMPYSPARLPPYSLPETFRLLKVDHYMLHLRIMMRLGGCAASSQNTDTDTGGQGSQAFRPPVHDERYGLPDIGVYISRFEDSCIWSGQQGLRGPIRRLERSLRGLRRAVEHVAEGQENDQGLLRGVLEEVMGS
jgi:hypothetical protein